MRTASRAARGDRGVTLIEIIVVIALMALMMAVAAPSLRSLFGVDQRRATQTLAATMRGVYEESVVRNQPMRIAYHLEEGSYWVEASDSAVIFRDRDEKDAFAEWLEAKKESDQRVKEQRENRAPPGGLLGGGDGPLAGLLSGLLGGGGGVPGGGTGNEYRVNEWVPVDDGLFTKRALPDSVRFWGVWTPATGDEAQRPMGEFEVEAMLKEPEEDQKWTIVYTHVFPGGYMEDSVVYLSDPTGEEVSSLVVEPLMGKVKVVQDYVDPPDTRDRVDE